MRSRNDTSLRGTISRVALRSAGATSMCLAQTAARHSKQANRFTTTATVESPFGGHGSPLKSFAKRGALPFRPIQVKQTPAGCKPAKTRAFGDGFEHLGRGN